MASDDDCQLTRDLFAHDDSADDDISEHTWTCPDTGIAITYHLAFQAPGHGTFGAGAALPSLALLKEGAKRVVMTDRFVNEETFEALRRSVDTNAEKWGLGREEIAERVAILPHTWGENVEKLTRTGKEDGCAPREKADLLIASDCICNPTYHRALLQSAMGTIDDNGILVVGYSFHGNVPKSQTLHFFAMAKGEFGLRVVNEFTKEYRGQSGIGSKDEDRGAVHVKVLVREQAAGQI